MINKTFSLAIAVILSISTTFAHNLYQACFSVKDKKFNLEVADTSNKRQTGLMYRHSLPEDAGMLFIFYRPLKTSFWMKNVEIPLDIIFLNNDKIVKVYHNVPPCKVEPCTLYPSVDYVNSVIELNAGTCNKYDIKEGDAINVQFIK